MKEQIGCDSDFDIKTVWECDEDIRSLKSLILFGLKGMAAYAHHTSILGYKSDEVNNYFYEVLRVLAEKNTLDELLPYVLKTGEINLKYMELLDKANTETYGIPIPPESVQRLPYTQK